MRKLFIMALMGFALCSAQTANADDRFKPNTSINELTELGGTSVTSSDYLLGYDDSAYDWVKIDPTELVPSTVAFNTAILGNPFSRTTQISADSAAISSGKTILAGATGVTPYISSVCAYSTGGTYDAGTDTVRLETDETGDAIDGVGVLTLGAFTDKTVVCSGDSGFTADSGMFNGLTAGQNLVATQVGNNSSDVADIIFKVVYTAQ